MEPPSTPAPVALRGRALDRVLCEAEPERTAWSGQEALLPGTPARETDRPMRFAEAFVIAERAERAEGRAPASDGPLSLRGAELQAQLDALRDGPPSGVRSRH